MFRHLWSSATTGWHGCLSGAERERTIVICRELAARLGNPEIVEQAIRNASQQTGYRHSVSWQPYSIAQGYSGLALLFGHMDLCLPAEGWDVIAHDYLVKASCPLERMECPPCDLHAGLSGLAYTAFYLSRGGKRYKKLLSAIDTVLLKSQAITCEQFLASKNHSSVHLWDVISGFSGISRYLLIRKNDTAFRPALNMMLECLVELANDVNGLPRWFTPVHLSPGIDMQKVYPEGSLNCGMAHGIPGPLAALSLARIQGIDVKGQESAIKKIADWLLAHRLDDKYGMNWPSAVAVRTVNGYAASKYLQTTEGLFPTHTGWCYGPSGVAASLWFAGMALNEREYSRKAVEIMSSIAERPLSERMIVSPAFCHGFAGQLQIIIRFAARTGIAQFSDEAVTLVRLLLSKYYDPNFLLGFQSHEDMGRSIDQAGLLDGVPGIILALLAASTDIEPKWDNIFMLS